MQDSAALFATLAAAPHDAGRVEWICRRPADGEREVLAEAQLDEELGLVGDNWSTRGSRHTEDGRAHPELQITLMSARVAAHVAGERERWALAGDQLFLDLDLTPANAPPGTRLALGTAELEVTDLPHTGCDKFTERFGVAATRLVCGSEGAALALRGRNARVVRGGSVRRGDTVRVLARGRAAGGTVPAGSALEATSPPALDPRSEARALARAAGERGRPLDWFEELYRVTRARNSGPPWADLAPNPELVAWAERDGLSGGRALVVGCGAGDDAHYLWTRSMRATGFDLSPTAIEWCRARFDARDPELDSAGPAPGLEFVACDLFDPPQAWAGAFDLVFEAFTLQSMPHTLHPAAMARIASFVAPGGRLLVLARGRDEEQPRGELPWPLTAQELTAFEAHGLELERAEDFLDHEDPPVRRLRFSWRRPG